VKVYKRDQTDAEKALSKRGKASRRKGHQFERDLVNRFNEDLKDFHAVRGLQSKGGRGAADVRLTGSLHEFHCECKKGKQPSINAAVRQAIQDHKFGSIPIAITCADREWTLVSMQLEDFIAILQALEGSQASGTVKVIASSGIRVETETRD